MDKHIKMFHLATEFYSFFFSDLLSLWCFCVWLFVFVLLLLLLLPLTLEARLAMGVSGKVSERVKIVALGGPVGVFSLCVCCGLFVFVFVFSLLALGSCLIVVLQNRGTSRIP